MRKITDKKGVSLDLYDGIKWKKARKKPVEINYHEAKEILFIETLEGVMKAEIGDIIIEGVNGELYPCKPDIFEKTYDCLGEK